MSKLLLLPGASGSASFWKPVADRAGVDGVFFAWPGLGDEPALPDISPSCEHYSAARLILLARAFMKASFAHSTRLLGRTPRHWR